jgi:erythromycin esterase-like protein
MRLAVPAGVSPVLCTSGPRLAIVLWAALTAATAGCHPGRPAAATPPDAVLARHIAPLVHPVVGRATDYNPLLSIGVDARFVLLGEQSHGTHEFYRERARITRGLIEEHGFTALVLEADWPSAERVNAYVLGESEDRTAREALAAGFLRFPRWMWRNEEFATFVEWIREFNSGRAPPEQVHVYGMDLYSFIESADRVVSYLDSTNPRAAAVARERYGCFAPFKRVAMQYGERVVLRGARSCERPAQEQLQELQRLVRAAARAQPVPAALLSAFQNARVAKNGEEYFRVQAEGVRSSWNLRDHHMADTLDELAAVHGGARRKLAVWAHNSHQGDALGTEHGSVGQWTLGQLMRRRHAAAALLVGFTTYAGEVIAASEWDSPGRRQRINPAMRGSFADLFHQVAGATAPDFLLAFRGQPRALALLHEPRYQRAIGVVYRPHTELASHYFRARLPQQFDAVIHLDQTSAVQPF